MQPAIRWDLVGAERASERTPEMPAEGASAAERASAEVVVPAEAGAERGPCVARPGRAAGPVCVAVRVRVTVPMPVLAGVLPPPIECRMHIFLRSPGLVAPGGAHRVGTTPHALR